MKGIILAGGSGKRLYPITKAISKQLLPVYDKPMIYYSLSVLMLAGIKDILLITTPHDQDQFKRLLGNGNQIGINLEYTVQEQPNGLAEAFLLGEAFIGSENVALILGDNLFYGQGFTPLLELTKRKIAEQGGATIFGYLVKDPQRFGVVEFDNELNVLSIEEKPESPRSSYAATGLYFYDNNVVQLAKQVEPSARGELEITAINALYLERGELDVRLLGRGFAWLDTGTHDSLLQASEFIHTIENRQGLKVACLEEIAYLNGWIKSVNLEAIADELGQSEYSQYLRKLFQH